MPPSASPASDGRSKVEARAASTGFWRGFAYGALALVALGLVAAALAELPVFDGFGAPIDPFERTTVATTVYGPWLWVSAGGRGAIRGRGAGDYSGPGGGLEIDQFGLRAVDKPQGVSVFHSLEVQVTKKTAIFVDSTLYPNGHGPGSDSLPFDPSIGIVTVSFHLSGDQVIADQINLVVDPAIRREFDQIYRVKK